MFHKLQGEYRTLSILAFRRADAPHFSGQSGICPELEVVIGIIEGHQRWSTFLSFPAKRSKTSLEFSDSWTKLTAEAGQHAAFLNVALESPLSGAVESAGGASEDGSTRRKLVQQR